MANPKAVAAPRIPIAPEDERKMVKRAMEALLDGVGETDLEERFPTRVLVAARAQLRRQRA